MLGSPILCLKAMRILMFQLSGFYCTSRPKCANFLAGPGDRKRGRSTNVAHGVLKPSLLESGAVEIPASYSFWMFLGICR